MDVADIAPALLGISELCKIANKKFNGDKAAVKVLIDTDVEHKCFQLDLHIFHSLWETTKQFLGKDDVTSAKDLIEWICMGGAAGIFSFFQLLKWIKGRKITSAKMEIHDGRDVVRITVQGDNNSLNVTLAHPQALELLRDPKAVENAKKLVSPLTRDGYESFEFEDSETSSVERIDREDALAISSIDSSDVEVAENDLPQIITAWITVYSPVYDLNAQKWRFKFGEAHENMDISETDIASMAIKRGGVLIDDAYKVRLQITQEHKPSGAIANKYKVLQVLDFRPSTLPYQQDAFRDGPEGNS